MRFSDYLIARVLNHVFGAAAGAPAPNHYFTLFTTLPDNAGGGYVEPATAAFNRLLKVNSTSLWTPAESGSGIVTNAAAVSWPVAADDFGTIVGVGVFNASGKGTGDLLVWDDVAPIAITTGETPKIVIGAGRITLQ
jgi:hypothetical protein